ncbi:MAG: VUT family protein [Clostridia bacterium]|nr:VUT family protein [Clostridia bacterium]MBQ4157845.1 VUT family protein [Clostridia bacterium]
MESHAKNSFFASLRNFCLREKEETALLLRCIPASVVTLFVVSVISMNLLANKTLLQLPWIALDGGILISWLSFMCMDVITKHFGPRASNRISVLASLVNLLTCMIFFIASIIPSNAADYSAFDSILGGTWFILLGSTIAFLSSAVINNSVNWTIGKAFTKNPHGKLAYAVQTYVSTFIGQFMDNFIFSVIVFTFFAPIFWDGFHWSFLQCAMCALTGALAELIMEILFSPVGYRIVTKWRNMNVGKEYISLIEKRRKP